MTAPIFGPAPAAARWAGVAERTREAMLVCEAAGFDLVIVETVGVGQSETAVHGMTDLFVLMQLPNAGDDLQAIKKGVMELADLVVINKADLDAAAATRAQGQITSSLRLLGMHGTAQDRQGRTLAAPGSAAQRAAGPGAGRLLGRREPLSRPADQQRRTGTAAPAPSAGLDVGAHRRWFETLISSQPAGAG